MDITTKLAYKQLKINRQRTMLTLIAIALSTALITAVYSFAASIHSLFVELLGYTDGEFDRIIAELLLIPVGILRSRIQREKSGHNSLIKNGRRGEKMGIIKFMPTNYPSDLTDEQWELIEQYFPQGANSVHHKRALINAVLYLNDNGYKWRAIPHDYPTWSTVHTFYFRARVNGLWDKVLDALVKQTHPRRAN